MSKPLGFFVALVLLALIGVGCVMVAPTIAPTAVPTRAPTAVPSPTYTSIPTATPLPPTATATFTAAPPPTVTRTPTTAPTPLLYRRYSSSYLVYPVSPVNEGCGTLAIENHLDLDVAVALVKYSATATRPNILAAVYVMPRRYFAILGLGADNFLGEGYVAIGEDWDPVLGKFTRKNQYLRTTDRMRYFANPDCSHWTIKVAPGAPGLQAIPENQFPSLW